MTRSPNFAALISATPADITMVGTKRIYLDGMLEQEIFAPKEGERKCKDCGVIKHVSKFYATKHNGEVCRECSTATARLKYVPKAERMAA